MRAVVYEAVGETPRVRDVPPPTCPPGGVLLQVAATGVCRSDWHAWRGHDPVRLPHIPGHEMAGVVAETGAQVRRFAVGDRVTVPFVCGCGACEVCRSGESQVCPNQIQPGFSAPGSFAELVVLPAADANLVLLPESLDFLSAAALGCRFGTAFRALTVHGRLRRGDWLAVFGCGGVGLSAVMIGAALGAQVVAVDVSPAALRLASALGAVAAVDSSAVDPVAAVREITGGAHVSMDALGSAELAASSVRSLRRRGRHLQVGLLVGDEADAPLPMDRVVAHELEIYGSHGMPAQDYPALLEMVSSGALHPERLVSRVISLDEAPAALMAMDKPSSSAGITVISLLPSDRH